MKRITNNPGQKNVRTVDNVCKKGFNNSKIYAYKRPSRLGLEEWAFLRRVSENHVGWVPLIGGPTYVPTYITDRYKTSLLMASVNRKVYEFKNLQEFLDKKYLL